MVELTKGQVCQLILMAFGLGVVWQIIFARVLAMGRKELETINKPKANGWKPKVLSNGMEVEISWTSHPSWRTEEIAKPREQRNWGAE